jgi:plasmid stabilization system protein ParE
MGSGPATRELVLSPLPSIVVYRARDSLIEVVRIWHWAQDRERYCVR